MRIDAGPRRARRLSLTSLIDVIFLLLLFFMLTSTFTRFAQVDVAMAGQGGAVAAGKPGVLLRLTAAGFEVNGEITDADGLEDRLALLKQTGATSGLVLVGVEGLSQDLVSALEAFRAAGLDVSVAR
ncbi:outer membrane transport energization protein ExbD [Hoeflea marina]|uniref:Outer membrane transport energization protein ExbD n=1 Tax=Hoeflea marina TaxID=274592 RepID=A0A317PT75_9HYPH|nr:biopolymer transporter ExbD [Hoeflea marina]PWW03844.1 outer membrane transport energization protein ExbD [Hoeflea marina]